MIMRAGDVGKDLPKRSRGRLRVRLSNLTKGRKQRIKRWNGLKRLRG